MKPSPTWFEQLAAARHEELKGWVRVAAILWTMDRHGDYWTKMGYESKADALAQPEIQLSPTTAQQYIAVYNAFRNVPAATLEASRPRLLHQAVKKIVDPKTNEPDSGKAMEAAIDAQAFSWSAFREKWGTSRK